jgi:hypothetical protein
VEEMRKLKMNNRSEHYKTQGIDTIKRAKANLSLEQQKGVCQFNIDKYLWREKEQNISDLKKVSDYLEWLIDIEMEIKSKVAMRIGINAPTDNNGMLLTVSELVQLEKENKNE